MERPSFESTERRMSRPVRSLESKEPTLMFKQISQFVAAAGLVVLAVTPILAQAKMLNLDGHACREVKNGWTNTTYCPIPTGSDFNPATIDYLGVQGKADTGNFGTQVCRRTFAQTTLTCGPFTGEYITAGAYSRWLDVAVVRGGNAWDYRYVNIYAVDSMSSEVFGLYVSNTP
jgi:hypothetical protein